MDTVTLIPGDRITLILDGKFTEMVVAGINADKRLLFLKPVDNKEGSYVAQTQR